MISSFFLPEFRIVSTWLIFLNCSKLKIFYFALPKFLVDAIRQHPHDSEFHRYFYIVNFLIITPVFNGTYFLKCTIDSIRAVTWFILTSSPTSLKLKRILPELSPSGMPSITDESSYFLCNYFLHLAIHDNNVSYRHI